ncbi:hypothetical protein CPB83DRAFT_907491 [Crepidotus variabilis]|uniref:Uncharacterized protein n=1 Tax=Crepidotus variabilis TaxID=179855 RepID=A0A9P6EEY7_9AGAR|nr:hypothetical protein CPB83DRAFT_907491 [Crepidotus variabilis]
MTFLAIEYPITRQIHWRYLTALSYVGALIVVVFLTTLNVALVGYETVNVFQSDFYATQDFWFYHFLPYGKPKPGTLCEPHFLIIGDHFKVRGSDVDWTILSITANGSNSGLPYTGSTLSSACDITRIGVSSNNGDKSTEVFVILECWDFNGVSMNASASLLSQATTSSDTLGRLLRDVQPSTGDNNLFMRSICNQTLIDFGLSGLPTIQSYSFTAVFRTPCLATATPVACGEEVPKLNASINMEMGNHFVKQDERPLDPYIPDGHDLDTYWPDQRIIWNLFQTIYALARANLANDSPNNFLLHLNALSMVLFKNISQTGTTGSFHSELFSFINTTLLGHMVNQFGESLFNVSGESLRNTSRGKIEAAYLCKRQHLKSLGNLVISVLVAVLSMFSTIWATYMWILSTLAKRSRGANTCIAHVDPSYHSVDSLETAVVASSSREEKAWWIEFMQLGHHLNKPRYERRPLFVADEIVLTSLPHARRY